MNELVQMEEEKYYVSRGMQEFGGGFVNALGCALSHADHVNQKKIKDTWPEYWKEYLEVGKKCHASDCGDGSYSDFEKERKKKESIPGVPGGA